MGRWYERLAMSGVQEKMEDRTMSPRPMGRMRRNKVCVCKICGAEFLGATTRSVVCEAVQCQRQNDAEKRKRAREKKMAAH